MRPGANGEHWASDNLEPLVPPPHVALFSLLCVTVISAVPLAALIIVADAPILRRAIPHLVGLGVGALLGSALLELIPESLARSADIMTPASLVLAGFLVFFVADRLLAHGRGTHGAGSVKSVVPLNFAGVLVHNAVDGMVIAASFLVSTALGISTAVAIFLHEIPHELGDFGIFVQGGLSTRRAAWLNFASAAGAYGGAAAMLLAGRHVSVATNYIIPFAAGNFIYIAASSLIPEMPRHERVGGMLLQIGAVLGGVVVVALPTILGHP